MSKLKKEMTGPADECPLEPPDEGMSTDQLIEKINDLVSATPHDVMYVGQSVEGVEGVDVSEVCSVPRICKEADVAGLRCGPTYDIVNGWDLSDPQVQKKGRR